jgi:hypothetical protein
VHGIQLSMVDGSLRRYLAGGLLECDYLSARNVQLFRTSRETARRAFGLTPGKGQIVEPTIKVATVASGRGMQPEDSSPPSAAPLDEEDMSVQAIHELARSPALAAIPSAPRRGA